MTNWVAKAERERKARIRSTPTAEQAAGVISWLRARLKEQMRYAGSGDRIIEVHSQLLILGLHAEVKPMTEYDQRVYPFRAFCAGESWTCYGDGEDFVQAPCLHVRLLARQFAWREEFPRLLVVTEEELAGMVAS